MIAALLVATALAADAASEPPPEDPSRRVWTELGAGAVGAGIGTGLALGGCAMAGCDSYTARPIALAVLSTLGSTVGVVLAGSWAHGRGVVWVTAAWAALTAALGGIAYGLLINGGPAQQVTGIVLGGISPVAGAMIGYELFPPRQLPPVAATMSWTF